MLLAFTFSGYIYGQNCGLDETPPTILLKSELVIDDNTFTNALFDLNLYAGFFDEGSSDNCTTKENLRFSFSPDPDDLYRSMQTIGEGLDEIEIWITDENGNQTSAITRLVINEDNCEVDNTPPVIYHPSYVPYSIILPQEYIDLNLSSFALSAIDNCTETLDLLFSYSPNEIVTSKLIPNSPGETTFDIWVTDEAGNQSSYTITYRLEGDFGCEQDNTPPFINLKSELVVASGSEHIIWPGAFDDGSADGCTAHEDLIFSFSPDIIDSQFEQFRNIPEEGLELTIWLIDEAGNKSSQPTLLKMEEDCEVDNIPPVGHFPSGAFSKYTPSNEEVVENEVRFYADRHDIYVTDNCTEQFSMQLSFDPNEIINQITFPYEPGASIDYTVWAFDEAGNRSSFQVHRYIAETDENCSEAPTDLTEVSKSTRHVELSWSDMEVPNGYILEGRAQGSNRWLRKVVSRNQTTIRRRFQAGVTYEWRVRANCSDEVASPYSEIKTFTIEEDAHTSVEGRGEAIFGLFEESKIYPSPASHTLTVESSQEIQQIEVFDMTGRRLNIVTPDNDQSIPLDVSRLLKGQYLIRLTSIHGVETLPFTKQ